MVHHKVDRQLWTTQLLYKHCSSRHLHTEDLSCVISL